MVVDPCVCEFDLANLLPCQPCVFSCDSCGAAVLTVSSMNIVAAENKTVCPAMWILPPFEDTAPSVRRDEYPETCRPVSQVTSTMPQPEVQSPMYGSHVTRLSHVAHCERCCQCSRCGGRQHSRRLDHEPDTPCACPIVGQQRTSHFYCCSCLLYVMKTSCQVYQQYTLIPLRPCAPACGFSLYTDFCKYSNNQWYPQLRCYSQPFFHQLFLSTYSSPPLLHSPVPQFFTDKLLPTTFFASYDVYISQPYVHLSQAKLYPLVFYRLSHSFTCTVLGIISQKLSIRKNVQHPQVLSLVFSLNSVY